MENFNKSEAYLKNVLSLAFLGDAVFTLMVREYLVKNHQSKPNPLNKTANSVVCAKFQAQLMEQIKLELVEPELDIVLRTRNTHLNSKAKNSSLAEYSLATQFEALVGYWYITDNQKRVQEIFNKYVVEKLC